MLDVGRRVLPLMAAMWVAAASPAAARFPQASAIEAARAQRAALLADVEAARAAGRTEEAISLLEDAAMRLGDPWPWLLVEAARLHRDAGDLERALDALRHALALELTDELRAEADALAGEVRAALGRGWLTVQSDTAGATVRIDGGPELSLPLRRAVLPDGEHQVEVRAPGAVPVALPVLVPPGEEVVLDVPLEAAATGGSEGVIAERAATEAPNALRGWGWVAVGVGGLVAVAGGALLGFASAEQADWEAIRTDDSGVAVDVTRNSALAMADRAKSMSTAGGIMLGVGGAFAATGVVMLLLAPNDEEPPIGVGIGPMGMGGASVQGRF